MANSVGIDVKINLPSKSKVMEDLKSKWGTGDNAPELLMNVRANKNSLNKMKSQIKSQFKDYVFEIDVKANFKQAEKGLKEFRQSYHELRKEMEKGLDMKFNPQKMMDKDLQGLFSGNSQKMKQAQQANKEYISSIKREAQTIDATTQKTTSKSILNVENSLKELDQTTKRVNAFRKEIESFNGEKLEVKTEISQKDGIDQYVKLTKESYDWEKKKVGATKEVADQYQVIIDKLNQSRKILADDFKTEFGSDINNNSDVAKAEAIGKANALLQQQLQMQQEQKAIEAQRKASLDDIVRKENEIYQLGKKSQNVGDAEKAVYDSQIAKLTEANNKRKESLNLTEQEKNALDALTAGNQSQLDFARNLTQAKSEDVAKVKEQQQALRELKTDLKEIGNVEKQISELKIKQEAGATTDKEDGRLRSLEAELQVREKQYEMSKKTAEADKTLTASGQKELDALTKRAAKQKEIADAKAKEEANVRKENAAYKSLEDSINKVAKLKKEMATAGSREASHIKEVIDAEEKKQKAITDSIKAQKDFNKEKLKEVEATKKAKYEQAEEDGQRNVAKRLDSAGANSSNKGILGRVRIDPIRVAQTAKQAFQTVYDSVAQLDEQMVNISKVSDEPAHVLEKFSQSVFDQASAVGKAADEYAGSVANWLTMGKSFEEAQELATASVMGAFVGNIDEQDMVKYMAVPLNAYKDSALEATDVINAMNEVANNNNAEMTELGEAYSRASATSATAGTSFSELTGMITAAQEATMAGGEKIGTALKTIDVTIGQIATKGTKDQLKKYNQLDEMGIHLKDENDQLRSTYDILQDMSGVWENLSPDEKTTASTALAGKNHANIIQGIVQNWETAEKATKEAQGQMDLVNKESGSAYEEFGRQQDSVAFKTNELKNNWNELLNTIAGGKDGVNGVLDVLIKGLEKANELVQNEGFMKLFTGGLKLGGLMVGAKTMDWGFSKIGASARGIADIIGLIGGAGKAKTGIGVFSGLSSGLTGVIGLFGKFVPWITVATVALAGLQLAGVDVVGGLTGLFEKLGGNSSTAKKEVENHRKAQEKLNEEITKGLEASKKQKEVNEVNKDFDDLIAKKKEALAKATKEAEENGTEKPVQAIELSSEEFEYYKGYIEDLAGEYGLEITVDHNNLDEVIEKLQLVSAEVTKINQADIQKGIDGIAKKTKYKKYKFLDDDNEYSKYKYSPNNARDRDFNEAKSSAQEKYNAGKLTNAKEIASEVQGVFEKAAKTAYAEAWSSPEAKKAEESNLTRISELKDTRSQLLTAAKEGYLPENVNKEGIRLMATELQGLSNKEHLIESINDKLKKGGELTAEEANFVEGLNPILENVNTKNAELWKPDQVEAYNAEVKKLKPTLEESKKLIEDTVRDRGKNAGMSDEAINRIIQNMQESKEAYIKELAMWGDEGASMLGVSLRFDYETKDKGGWENALIDMQKNIDSMSEEELKLAIKYDLVSEDGFANIDKLDDIYNLPDSVSKHLGLIVEETGAINIQEATKFTDALANMPEEYRTKLDIDSHDGVVSLEEFINHMDRLELDEFKEIMLSVNPSLNEGDVITMISEITGLEPQMIVDATANVSNIDGTINDALSQNKYEVTVGANLETQSSDGEAGAEKIKSQIDGYFASNPAKVSVVPEVQKTGLSIGDLSTGGVPSVGLPVTLNTNTIDGEIQGIVSKINGEKGTVEVDISDNNLTGELEGIKTVVVALDDADPKVEITETGAASTTLAADGVKSSVESIPTSVNISFTASKSGDLIDLLNKARGGGITIPVKSGKAPSIVASISESIASSFSVGAETLASATSVATSNSTSSTKSKGNPRYARDKIDQDIWRYWSKELFTGLPLEQSMNNLKRSIDKAADNEAKLISLYKQQQALITKQIKYEQDMKNATQAEMNAILSDLRKQGFKTSGNRVTNLGHAKNIKGEDAVTLANENLNKYKDLYSKLDDYTEKILSLQFDKQKLNDDIKDAEITKELKSIEKRIKKSEALLTAISNNTSIMSKKVGFAGDGDFELQLTLNEEGMNRSKSSMKILIDEFNALSKTYVKHAENAGEVQSQLENLKTQIIENADAILDYQSAIRDIKIDRLANDINKFSDVMDRNISKVKSNIDQIKDGLLSGTSLSDLQSSGFDSLNLQRKTKLEKEYEQRLALEAELNEALDGYAKKNVDRTAKVANAVLTVEQNKYAQLLKMQKEFTDGKVSSVKSITPSAVVGKTGVENAKAANAWTKELEKINNDYIKVYDSMVKKYDQAMANAKNQAERDIITNDFIINQLKLQEEMYQKTIDMNRKAITQAKEMLKDTGLSTSQREDLEQQIKDLEDGITASQESIKEAVKSRYELEFELLDELSDKAKQYSTELEELLQINDLVNGSPSDRDKLLTAIYESYINQYGNARKELSRLLKEQSKVSEGSMEWKLLQDRIEEVRGSINGLTIDILEANKSIMENRMDSVQSLLAQGLFDGKTTDQWETFIDKWMVGLEKELELDKIRRRAIALENDMYDKKIEALDKQEAVSKKDLEYLDKQLSVLELEEKLQGLQSEKNVQTLVQKDDGSWQWEYVADQTEIDKTKDELDDAKLELEKFRNEQRSNYFKDLSGILDNAKDGKFDNTDDLKSALQTLRDAYGYVLDDIPGLDMGNYDEIIQAYEDYLNNNKNIISETTTGEISPEYEALVEKVGARFEQGFMNIATDLGNIIAEALRNAISGTSLAKSGESYIIENQELVFPNVTNTDGFREVLETLPAATKQETTKK